MKKHYDTNHEFGQLIKIAISLSFIQLEDLESGIQWLQENTNISNESEADFKNYFIDYIPTFIAMLSQAPAPAQLAGLASLNFT